MVYKRTQVAQEEEEETKKQNLPELSPLKKEEKKETEKEVELPVIVVKELPTQQVRINQFEDGSKAILLTESEALTEILEKVRSIEKVVKG
jgi:hypothetical protein